LRAVVP